MPNYRRPFAPGGTFFFTLVTQDRRPILTTDSARPLLRTAVADTRRERPFVLLAIVLLADHLHLLLDLPAGDADFATRRAAVKARFTRAYLAAGGGEGTVTANRAAHGGRGVWQPRYYDHLIRDEDDFGRHLDYLHYNPAKHGRGVPARVRPLDVRQVGGPRRVRPGLGVLLSGQGRRAGLRVGRRPRHGVTRVWRGPPRQSTGLGVKTTPYPLIRKSRKRSESVRS